MFIAKHFRKKADTRRVKKDKKQQNDENILCVCAKFSFFIIRGLVQHKCDLFAPFSALLCKFYRYFVEYFSSSDIVLCMFVCFLFLFRSQCPTLFLQTSSSPHHRWKNLQSIAWFCWRLLNRIHSRWKFLQTEKPQPKWGRWDDDFSCAFFYIAQLISIGWFKSGVSFFTFFASCFFLPMFGAGTLFHFTPCWWNGYCYHQPSVLLFFDICILLVGLPLTASPALIKHTLKASESWVSERPTRRKGNHEQYFFLQNWLHCHHEIHWKWWNWSHSETTENKQKKRKKKKST